MFGTNNRTCEGDMICEDTSHQTVNDSMLERLNAAAALWMLYSRGMRATERPGTQHPTGTLPRSP